jgi:branched-chain amino acid transport system permease protein
MTTVASAISDRAAPINLRRPAILTGLAVAAAIRLFASDYWLNSLIIPTIIMGLAGLGLNLLMGYAGLVSLGSAAFMSIGAFSAYNLLFRVPVLPLPFALVGGGLIAAIFDVLFGLPSLRIKGFYLSASTLGAQFFFEWLFTNFHWFSNDSFTLTISAPRLEIFGHDLNSSAGRYLLVVAATVPSYWLAHNIIDSRIGRDWMAIRDMDTAAAVAGIPIGRRKLLAYGVSSFFCGVAGALWAFCYLGTADAHAFDLDKSFEVLFIVIIGGSASLADNFLGAAFIVLTPIALDLAVLGLGLDGRIDHGTVTNALRVIFGAIIILLLIKSRTAWRASWAGSPDSSRQRDPTGGRHDDPRLLLTRRNARLHA